MNLNSARLPLLITLCCGLINGCGVTEQIKQNYQESMQTYYAPESLESNTQSTGILLVDAVTTKIANTMPLSGVAIVNVNDAGKEITIGSFKTGGLLSQQSGVVIIPNLQPGIYKIVKIRTQNVNMWETLNMPDTKEFEVEISAGKPIYFGQIQVKHPFASTDRAISVKHDKTRESESWKLVLDKYSESPWGAIIDAQINALK